MKTLSIELRPSSLEEVIGHEDVKRVLRAKIAKDEIPVAFLLSGPPGVGKTTLAEIIARLVQGDVPEGTELDITTIPAADKNGVDDMRELAEKSLSFPMAGRFKVYILDEAHKLTGPAQDCLLIPTEAKDSSTVWIFSTTEPAKLSAALRSRCLHFDLKPLDKAGISALISRAVKDSAPDIDEVGVADYLFRVGVRSPREILMSVEKYLAGTPLEQCVLGSEHEPLYADVARSVLAGNWSKTRQLLSGIKTADARGLRNVVAAFLGSALISEDVGARADAISGCLLALGQNFEDGIAYRVTQGALYRLCKHLGGAK